MSRAVKVIALVCMGFVLMFVAISVVQSYAISQGVMSARALGLCLASGTDACLSTVTDVSPQALAKLRQDEAQDGKLISLRIQKALAQVSGLPAVIEVEMKRTRKMERRTLYYYGGKCLTIGNGLE